MAVPVGFIQRHWRLARRELLALLVAGAIVQTVLVVEGLSRTGDAAQVLDTAGQRLQTLATIFLGIFFEAVPFLLLGALVAAALRLYVSDGLIRRLAARGGLASALLGGSLGVAFPACECSAVAVGRRLLGGGACVSLGVAFMLASPVVNPLVFASTWAAFGLTPALVGARLGVAFAVAVVIGLIFSFHSSPANLLARFAEPPAGRSGRGLSSLLGLAAEEFLELVPYLVAGGLAAAALQTFVPRGALLGLGQDPVLSVAAMMLLAVLLSVCSSVDAFVAASFAGTFMPGALLAFMLFGPIVNLKSMAMYGTVLSRRAIVVLVVLCAQFVFLAGAFVNLKFS
jgi:uncharacterized membrane protein YraQ (UPF0718 family)